MQMIKWHDNTYKQVKQHISKIIFTSLLLFYVFSPSQPLLAPLSAFPQFGGQGLHMARLPLVTKENWADNQIPLSWESEDLGDSHITVTDVMSDPGQIRSSPRCQFPLYKGR